MRLKQYFLFGVVLLSGLVAEAQVKLGAHFSPGISFSRFNTTSDTLFHDGKQSGLRFVGGITIDYEFAQNYFLSTGISFETRKAGYRVSGPSPSNNTDVFNVQYIQIPVNLKLYTNEIAIDKEIYFKAGGFLSFKVKDNITNKSQVLIDRLMFFDTGINFGSGLEMGLGTNTAAYGGLLFQIGLVNMARDHVALDNDAKMIMKNSLIGLEIGVKF